MPKINQNLLFLCYRKVNRVFGSPSDFICPDSSLQNQFLLYPRAQKPLKKWNSFEDLQQLSHEKQSFQNKSNAKLSASTDETLFAKQEFKRLEINSNNKSQSDLTINKLNKTTDDSYELKCFKSYSSLESAEDSSEKFNINAKALMRSIKVKSPVTLALQISKIDRECFLRLKRDQIFYCMIGGQDSNEVRFLSHFKDNKNCDLKIRLHPLSTYASDGGGGCENAFRMRTH